MKKRNVVLIGSAALAVLSLTLVLVLVFAKDPKDAFLIKDAKGLMRFAEAVNAGESYQGAGFRLGRDVDLKGAEWRPIGSAERPFKGSFDGGGRSISNFKITGSFNTYIGLFGYVEGNVTNLRVENFVIDAGVTDGGEV